MNYAQAFICSLASKTQVSMERTLCLILLQVRCSMLLVNRTFHKWLRQLKEGNIQGLTIKNLQDGGDGLFKNT